MTSTTSIFTRLSSVDISETVALLESSPVVSALATLAVAAWVPKVIMRFFPMTRDRASRLSYPYRRALRRSKKLPRRLRFRYRLRGV